MYGLPVVVEGGMSGRNVQRKLRTTRGSPRRSRTAKTSPISRSAVKSRCAKLRLPYVELQSSCSAVNQLSMSVVR
jgi:hypothetical protein